jgi:hypothetical protein
VRGGPETLTGLVRARTLFLSQAAVLLLVAMGGLGEIAVIWHRSPGDGLLLLWTAGGVVVGVGVGAFPSRKLARRRWREAGPGPRHAPLGRLPWPALVWEAVLAVAVFEAVIAAALLAHFSGALTAVSLELALAMAAGQQLGLGWWTGNAERERGGQLLVRLRRGRLRPWWPDLWLITTGRHQEPTPG